MLSEGACPGERGLRIGKDISCGREMCTWRPIEASRNDKYKRLELLIEEEARVLSGYRASLLDRASKL